MTKHIAIIGGESFTAYWLKRELNQRNYKVFLTQRKIPDQSNFLDLNQRNSFKRFFSTLNIDVVIILAGLSRSTRSEFRPYFKSNTLGSSDLVSFICSNVKSVSQVIFASTSHVYGTQESNSISEMTSPYPANYYGHSKLIAEMLLREIAEDKLTIVRPFNYTGIGQSETFIVPKLVHAFARKQKLITLGNTFPYRDFSDVRDMCRFYANIVDFKITGKTLNFCSGIGVSINDIVSKLSAISGHSPIIETDPNLFRIETACQIGSPELSKELRCFSQNFSLHDTLSWMYDSALRFDGVGYE